MKMDYQFKDVRFMTAADKRNVLRQWIAFLKSGFAATRFMKSLYEHLTLHCSFIAHFNRGGFYEAYFKNPSDTERFLNQFDRSKGCRSVEYGDAGWLNDEEYRDLNGAMVEAATGALPELRQALRERETVKARQEFDRAERRLKEMLATT